MQMTANPFQAFMRAREAGELVTLAPVAKAPGRFPVTFTPDGETDSDPPYAIRLDVVIDDGRFLVEQMTCTRHGDGPPVTSEGIRTVPVGRLLAYAAFRHVFVAKKAGGGRAVSPFAGTELAEGAKQGPTDEVLRNVAVVYQVHYACGVAPTKGVENSFKLARSTAGRWIAMARERGFLDPATSDASGTRTESDI